MISRRRKAHTCVPGQPWRFAWPGNLSCVRCRVGYSYGSTKKTDNSGSFMASHDDRQSLPPAGAYRVVGVLANGSRELCAAGVSRQIAETVAALERKIRNYTEILVEPDDDIPSGGKRSRRWN